MNHKHFKVEKHFKIKELEMFISESLLRNYFLIFNVKKQSRMISILKIYIGIDFIRFRLNGLNYLDRKV